MHESAIPALVVKNEKNKEYFTKNRLTKSQERKREFYRCDEEWVKLPLLGRRLLRGFLKDNKKEREDTSMGNKEKKKKERMLKKKVYSSGSIRSPDFSSSLPSIKPSAQNSTYSKRYMMNSTKTTLHSSSSTPSKPLVSTYLKLESLSKFKLYEIHQHATNALDPALQELSKVVGGTLYREEKHIAEIDQQLFGVGHDLFGRLGLDDATKITDEQYGEGQRYDKPTPLYFHRFQRFPSPIIQVKCGEYHSAFLCENGSIYVCGLNNKGQIGMGSLVMYVRHPTELQLFSGETAQSVVCGRNHTMILSKSGKVFCYGDNSYGQLGISPSVFRESFVPVMLSQLLFEHKSVIDISVGEQHSYFVTVDRDVYVCGCNEKGQLGVGFRSSIELMTKISLNRIANISRLKQISLGRNHSIMLLHDHSVYATGSNCYGELGIENIHVLKSFVHLQNLDCIRVKEVKCGSFMTIYLCENNSVYACGMIDFKDGKKCFKKPTKIVGEVGIMGCNGMWCLLYWSNRLSCIGGNNIFVGSEILQELAFPGNPGDFWIQGISCGYHHAFLVLKKNKTSIFQTTDPHLKRFVDTTIHCHSEMKYRRNLEEEQFWNAMYFHSDSSNR